MPEMKISMLNIDSRTSKNISYYTTDFLHKGESCSVLHEVANQWGGKGAQRLGLAGVVFIEDFEALCHNIHPQTGKKLTVRTKAGRRIGYDMTIDVPKSVSILQAFSKDNRIMEAYQNALDETLTEIETNVQTRVRVKNQKADRTTGNMVYAKLTHFMARPQGKGIPDPQLHSHVFILNATFDEQENRWKAIELGQTKLDSNYYLAIFNSKLANNLKSIGYKIRPTKYAFEIQGVPQSAIDEFSRRTAHIEKVARKNKITNPKTKARLGVLTREAKKHDLPTDELKELWNLRLSHLSEKDKHALEKMLMPPQETQLEMNFREDMRAVKLACEHCFYHNSVIEEKELIATALRFGVGQTNVEQIRKAIAQDKRLWHKQVDGRKVITSPDILLQEEAIVNWVRRGLQTCPPLAHGYESKDEQLDEEFHKALKHVLESRDRVTGVHGKSGAGKTTLMKETIAAIESHGNRVVVLAPTTDASRRTLRRSGFPGAETVEKLMNDPVMQQKAAGGVLWVDEAGLLSVPATQRLTDLADRIDARMILSGDVRQHGPVERGDALRILMKHSGLEMAELNTIRRQQNIPYREAVNDLSEGRIAEGFQKLEEMGAIREIKDEIRHEYLANAYIGSVEAERTALVVSPTHAEGRKMTTLIRQGLKEKGRLKKERTYSVLQKIDLTPAEKKEVNLYRTGWVLQLKKSAPGCRCGERLVIADINEQGLFVHHANGHVHPFDTTKYADRFEVYEHATIEVGIGEQIRITRNGKAEKGKRRLDNGTIATVSGFTRSGDIRLETGQVVSRHYGHFTHGYVTTSYAAQSKTVQDIYIAESLESFPAASWEQFYVAISRGVDNVVLVTNNKRGLFRVVQKSNQRMSAMDVVNCEEVQPDHEQEIEQAQHRAERAAKMQSYFGRFPIQAKEQQREQYHKNELVFEP